MRRHLAVRMSNDLVYSNAGVDNPVMTDRLADADQDEDLFQASPTGTACFSYIVFIQPFVEKQLGGFLRMKLDPLMRPENIPGDKEIKLLCDKFGFTPVMAK